MWLARARQGGHGPLSGGSWESMTFLRTAVVPLPSVALSLTAVGTSGVGVRNGIAMPVDDLLMHAGVNVFVRQLRPARRAPKLSASRSEPRSFCRTTRVARRPT